MHNEIKLFNVIDLMDNLTEYTITVNDSVIPAEKISKINFSDKVLDSQTFKFKKCKYFDQKDLNIFCKDTTLVKSFSTIEKTKTGIIERDYENQNFIKGYGFKITRKEETFI